MPERVAPLDMAAVQVPWHFRCPISLELMRDPVTVATGQTYDRMSIESWIAAGNSTCPRIPTPKQPAEPAAVRCLLSQAESPSSAEPARVAALRRLRSLAGDSDGNRAVISTPENRASLLSLSFRGAPPSSCPAGGSAVAVEALSVVAMLPLSEQDSASVAGSAERLSWLSALLSFHPSAETRADAAAVVEARRGMMEGLVRMLGRDRRSTKRAIKAAIRALFSLCLVKQNRERAAPLGAAKYLVDRVASGELDRGDMERALATVELLCRVDRAREALAAHGGVVAALVKVLAVKVSDRAAEHAAGTLAALCGASEALQREAVAGGVLTRLLLMVQSDCSERAKRKAQLLLKLLRAAWPAGDSLAISDDFQVHPSAGAVPTASFLC
ncbi:unnamed protein product [Spirodela intermedia]|uniref:U-box domain-containing protein n=1 Tax=Spirodela intermedia TaxID=51605 RepID=A0A7I8JFS8_SPIIN|nr:unnamed protein product [Spirodela intermedia]CAA6668373.1 unnamed protein product [Spirodela intermedia]